MTSFPELPFAPEFLEPLDRSGQQPPFDHEPSLFADEAHYLRISSVVRTRSLWKQVSTRVSELLEDGERLLFAAPSMITDEELDHKGTIPWVTRPWQREYVFTGRTLLVLSTERIFEFLLDSDGESPLPALRTWRWTACRELLHESRTLTFVTTFGEEGQWFMDGPDDGELLTEIVPRIRQRFAAELAATSDAPHHHCHHCFATLLAKDDCGRHVETVLKMTHCPTCNRSLFEAPDAVVDTAPPTRTLRYWARAWGWLLLLLGLFAAGQLLLVVLGISSGS